MHVSSHAVTSSVRPLLKWAGGKRQLLPVIRPHYPAHFSRYIEPFFGSGAVFFDLQSGGRLDRGEVRLADVNPDLVGCYRTLRDHTDAVIAELRRLERAHRTKGDACYYEVRDEHFNPLRRTLAERAEHAQAVADAYTPALAAMLIFLNRTGFNGLFRLNRHGAFNVPVGRYTDPTICDPQHLRSVAAAFRSANVTITCMPFEQALADAGRGDFIYCDPPYAPLSRTASFAHYTAGGFSAFDQRRLQQAVVTAARRGAKIVLSNSSAPEIVELYSSPSAESARLALHLVPARRAINSRASARGVVNEVLVSNVKIAGASLETVKPKMARAALPRRARTA